MEKYKFTADQLKIFESAQIPFAIYQFVDKRVVTLALSKGFCDLFGYTDIKKAYDDMDNNMYVDTHIDDVAHIADAAIKFANEKSNYDVVYRSKKPNSNEYNIIHAIGKHIRTEDGTRLAQVWYTNETDLLEKKNTYSNSLQKSLNEKLYNKNTNNDSSYHYLTGLPAMTRFFELATNSRDKLLSEGKSPVLLFLDFSGMKYYNSKYGFAEGNKLLIEFAKVLTKYFKNESCGHFGQDHFTAVTSLDKVEGILENLFKDCENLNDGKTIPIRVGIYKNETELVDASIASDRAKIACNTLRNTYVSSYVYFDESMLRTINHRQYIINNLDKAIKENWIKVFYQPIVRAVSGKVCEEEALARWIDPVKGMLSPADFIPVLENIKQIHKLDLYVVSEVIKKIKAQKQAGLHVVPQSVNLSRYDFETCDIVEEIRTLVDEASISRDLITIEVTESVIGSNFDYIKEQIEKFRAYGFAVWLDDFGSGYSSIDTLQSIPFDLIKFDMRFVQRLDDNPNSKIVLSDLIKMASSLNIDTVCEGIETEEQLHFLQDIGCSKLQGYYFTKPLSFEDVLKRYEQGMQIGFEESAQSEYYEQIGRANLYDFSTIATEDEYSFQGFYKTIPMAIIELSNEAIKYTRSNASFRTFMQRSFDVDISKKRGINEISENEKSFISVIKQCVQGGNRLFIDEKLPDDSLVHYFTRKIAKNKVNGRIAIAVAVISIVSAEEGTTYENIAKALSRDYFNLFYVNTENEAFIEYNSKLDEDDITIERHGTNFFEKAREDALKRLYHQDRADFIKYFNKEYILKEIKEQGTFTLTYRLLIDESPVYVNMKIMKMGQSGKYIIIGVSNVDSQMRQKEALDRIKQEQTTYLRLKALSEDYMCIYTVDLNSGYYVESSAMRDYESLGISKEGSNFFEVSHQNAKKVVYKDDVNKYIDNFTKENILKTINEKGMFELKYHMVIYEKLVYVYLKAVLVKEEDGDKLIVGVTSLEEKK